LIQSPPSNVDKNSGEHFPSSLPNQTKMSAGAKLVKKGKERP
jgi:hypothetical protein